MKFIYIQTLQIGKKIEIPYRITIGDENTFSKPFAFLIRPEMTIAKKIYDSHHLDRQALLSAPLFCDIADELIELFLDETLVFFERKQFSLLKSQFKTIGYNFNAQPKILWNAGNDKCGERTESSILNSESVNLYSAHYGRLFIGFMHSMVRGKNGINSNQKAYDSKKKSFDLSIYKSDPGVYFFLDEFNKVLYVGKAKNIRKRLSSHFSSASDANKIDYFKICSITVEYTGNDIIAQLIESENIKLLKPFYNTQQVMDAAPFIINKGQTAKGIHRLKITRKDIQDNMPEKHFNKLSVKQSLEEFCTANHLCRKHCGIETVKGPCSNYTLRNEKCICAGNENIELYNHRFDIAFHNFQNIKTRKVYKLKGRSLHEDAFIYTVNGIYNGYGFIDKNDTISTENDLLGNLVSMNSNYDTSRIISGLSETVSKEHVLILE